MNQPNNCPTQELDQPTEEWKSIPKKVSLVVASGAVGFAVGWQFRTGATFAIKILRTLGIDAGEIASRIHLMLGHLLK